MEDLQKDEVFGDRVFCLRSKLPKKGRQLISQKTVAKRAGISEKSYNWAEQGIIPGEAVLSKLARFFGVSVDFLLTGDSSINKDKEGAQSEGVEGADSGIDLFDEALAALRVVFESKDTMLADMLLANIREVQQMVYKERHIREQALRIKLLEKYCDQLKKEIADQMKQIANNDKRISALEENQ